MYKVTVKTRGKYNNATLGARYCFTKRSVAGLAVTFTRMECEFEVEKFIHCHGDVFAWSTADVSWKIWEKIDKALDKEPEE